MLTLCKKYRRTSNINVSLSRNFSELNLYWLDFNISNSLAHRYLSGTMVLDSAWLVALHSTYELEIKYSVGARCECYLRAHFANASTRI